MKISIGLIIVVLFSFDKVYPQDDIFRREALRINDNIVEVQALDGWHISREVLGRNMGFMYYGPPGLSQDAAMKSGYDGVTIKVFDSDISAYSGQEIEDFYSVIKNIPGLPGFKAEISDETTVAALCFLNNMCRITGKKLINNKELVINMYIRDFPADEDLPASHLDARRREFQAIIHSMGVYDHRHYEGDYIELTLSSWGLMVQYIAHSLFYIFKAGPYILGAAALSIVLIYSKRRRGNC